MNTDMTAGPPPGPGADPAAALSGPPPEQAVPGRMAPDLTGRTVVITGGSSGIGAAAARQFRRFGATVALVGRTPSTTHALAAEIGAVPYVADFTRLAEVRELADALLARHPRIDVLANNAGAILAHRTLTPDGIEATFQVNHLAPFLLTRLLLDRLAEAPHARVVATASLAYRGGRLDLDDVGFARRDYHSMRAYAASKLAVLIHTRELAHRLRGTGTRVTASAFHPGTVRTAVARQHRLTDLLVRGPLGRHLLHTPLVTTPERGALPLLCLATTADPGATDGVYYHRLRPEEPRNDQAHDPVLAARLWRLSEQLTGLPRAAGATW